MTKITKGDKPLSDCFVIGTVTPKQAAHSTASPTAGNFDSFFDNLPKRVPLSNESLFVVSTIVCTS